MLLKWFVLNPIAKHWTNMAISYAFKFDENIIAVWTFYFPDLLQCVQEHPRSSFKSQDPVLGLEPYQPTSSIEGC